VQCAAKNENASDEERPVKKPPFEISRRHLLQSAAAAAALPAASLLSTPALAQAYPTQDVRFICGFAAGSGADIIVRYFSEKMRALFNHPVIVENRPGAIGNIATEYVARSKPDGHTIYVTGANSVAANMHLFKHPTVDVAKQLQIVATINNATMMLGVRADSPYKDAKELTAAMKKKGDKVSYGYTNPTARVLGAFYKKTAGLAATEIGYKTAADYFNDLGSGNLDYVLIDNVAAMAYQRAGRIKLLGVGANTRMKSLPDLPTLTEQGYPMDVRSWWAALVPSATPRPIVDQLNKWFSQVVATEDTRKFLADVAASDPWISTPDEGQAYFVKDIERWGEYVKLANIEPQG
jgi:tripartite-type tricarboxylate transporter receptor subunit TctC